MRDDSRVHPLVCSGHGGWREPALGLLSTSGSVKFGNSAQHIYKFILGLANEPRHTVLDHFRHTAAVQRQYWVPHASASTMTSPNGSGQRTGNNNAAALRRNSALS